MNTKGTKSQTSRNTNKYWQIPACPTRGPTVEQTKILNKDIEEADYAMTEVLNYRKLKKGYEGEYLCRWNTGEDLYSSISHVNADAPELLAAYNAAKGITNEFMELGGRINNKKK